MRKGLRATFNHSATAAVITKDSALALVRKSVMPSSLE
jgi:hypothetical protein